MVSVKGMDMTTWRNWELEARTAAKVGRRVRFSDAARGGRFEVEIDSVNHNGFSGFVTTFGEAKKYWMTFPYSQVRRIEILQPRLRDGSNHCVGCDANEKGTT